MNFNSSMYAGDAEMSAEEVWSPATEPSAHPLSPPNVTVNVPRALFSDPRGQLVSFLIGHEGDNRKKGLQIYLIRNKKMKTSILIPHYVLLYFCLGNFFFFFTVEGIVVKLEGIVDIRSPLSLKLN